MSAPSRVEEIRAWLAAGESLSTRDSWSDVEYLLAEIDTLQRHERGFREAWAEAELAREQAEARVLALQQELAANAKMLARQCDLAREAEAEIDALRQSLPAPYTCLQCGTANAKGGIVSDDDTLKRIWPPDPAAAPPEAPRCLASALLLAAIYRDYT